MWWNLSILLHRHRKLWLITWTDVSVDLKEEDILGDAICQHWYYRSKASALLDYVKQLNPQSVLDVGAGSGYFSKELLKKTGAKDALCIDTSYPSERDELVSGKLIHYTTHSGPVDADLVLMMDVLEHVDDDVGLLSEYTGKVPADTHFLITVPAFSFLWSGHDVFLGHKRRYTLKEIEKVAANAGLIVERASYFFGLVFPLVAVLRLLDSFRSSRGRPPRSQLKRHNPISNATLMGICNVDRRFLYINRLVGLSAFCLARKP